MMWTKEKVLALAPDVITAERGKDLATARKWHTLHGNEKAIWGTCRGSNAPTYQTFIQPAEVTYRCSCPSRKTPCKHIIGLFLIYILDSSALRITDTMPDWVNLGTMETNQSFQIDKKKSSDAIAKSEADKLKRRNQRLAFMSRGVEDLEAWLLDIIRQGMATTQGQPFAFWQQISSRMVDTQLTALGPRIRSLQLLHSTYSDWPDRMLQEIAALYLMVSGFKNRTELSPDLEIELLRIMGINDKKSDLLLKSGITDDWGVLGIFEGVNIDNGAFRRTWLRGRNSKKMALILDFNYNNTGYDFNWEVGKVYPGEMVFYPSSFPLRGLMKGVPQYDQNITLLSGHSRIEDFLKNYAQALNQNPWLLNFPCCLEKVVPVRNQAQLFLIDQDSRQIPVYTKERTDWQLLALSGNHPITVFGEWIEDVLIPLSVVADRRFVKL